MSNKSIGSLYSSLGESAINAARYGSEARNESIRRRGNQALREERRQQVSSLFSALGQGVAIGSNIYGNYKSNLELAGFAEARGFNSPRSKFSMVFGSPKFSRGGVEYDQSFLYGLMELDQYRKQRNLIRDMGGNY